MSENTFYVLYNPADFSYVGIDALGPYKTIRLLEAWHSVSEDDCSKFQEQVNSFVPVKDYTVTKIGHV